jgi:tRNA dimethylallyltransferase
MEKKLLIVCGPTATGKTSLAVTLAKRFDGELVSADSRQVYKQMDIGTGKDLPKNAKWQMTNAKWGYYEVDGIKLYGYDLVDPLEEFSVAHYTEIVQPILQDMWNRGKLPILVGGTGFYIKAIVDGIGTMHIPSDPSLRYELNTWSVEKLFEKLEILDSEKARSMNTSDKRNPARLIRAIEVVYWRRSPEGKKYIQSTPIEAPDTLFIGLTLPRAKLFEQIADRVVARIDQGIKEEIESLLIEDLSWEHQSMNAMGYREWQSFFEGTKTEHEVILEWIGDEQKYAKRQMTWFKKDKRIKWFDVNEKEYPENVVNLVNSWHTNEI